MVIIVVKEMLPNNKVIYHNLKLSQLKQVMRVFSGDYNDLINKPDLSLKANLVNGKVPAAELPSFVDDIIEGYYDKENRIFYIDEEMTHSIEPESNKVYLDLLTNLVYRWSGSTYAEVSQSIALGETSSTAFPGDRGRNLELAMVTVDNRLHKLEEKKVIVYKPSEEDFPPAEPEQPEEGVEYANSDKLYVSILSGDCYRWDGSEYIEISKSLKIGETEDTAFAGSRGKAVEEAINEHVNDIGIHLTSEEKERIASIVDRYAKEDKTISDVSSNSVEFNGEETNFLTVEPSSESHFDITFKNLPKLFSVYLLVKCPDTQYSINGEEADGFSMTAGGADFTNALYRISSVGGYTHIELLEFSTM